MISLLKEQGVTAIKKRHLINLEEKIIKTLDFSLRDVSPHHFLERYFRLFGIDQEKKDNSTNRITSLARDFCRYMLREAKFLRYRPSQLAAAALMLSINICKSNVAHVAGVTKIPNMKMSIIYETLFIHTEIESGERIEERSDNSCPLHIWSNPVEKLTSLKREPDIKPAYKELIESVNEDCYCSKLSTEASLFF